MIAVRLRSDDSAAQRAANLLELCGLTRGDPREVEITLANLEEGLAAYMEIDGIGYDAALDSYRSYYAAIAAIRKQKEAGSG